MSFEKGVRRGNIWNDVIALDAIIKKTRFNRTGKDERFFENSFSSILDSKRDEFNGEIISQLNKDTSVKSVYCFGKNHRPDLTINEDGIAVEIKYINGSFDGVKMAFGQSLMYRLRYKFVFNIFVLSEKHKDIYVNICNNEESDLEDIFQYLSSDMNVFSYIVPAFSTAQITRA